MFKRALMPVIAVLSLLSTGAMAIPLTLTPPTSDFVAGGAGGTRGDIVTTSANFGLTSIGIEAQIEDGQSLTFDAYVYSSTGRVATTQLAVGASTVVTGDGTLKFYDLPIAFTLLTGQEYDIGVDFNGFSASALQLHYFNFAFPDPSFTVGPITVLDGEESRSGPTNAVTPNLRLNGAGATVPEPGTLALLGLGVAGLAASRRRKQ